MKSEAYRLMEDLDSSHWWFRARAEIICATVAKFVAPSGEIVDFGSGTGGTAVKLHDLGFRVTAADVSQRVLPVCQARGLPTIDLSQEWLPRDSADCVLACDVLEHVEDDAGLLARLREAIRPGGHFIGTVPACEFLWSGEDYVSEHVRRYTQSGLKERLRSAGYDVVWCSYFNTILFPLAFAIIMGKRLFRPRDMYRSNVQPLPNWENEILYKLFSMEKRMLNWIRFPFGVSIIVVAECRSVPGIDGQENNVSRRETR